MVKKIHVLTGIDRETAMGRLSEILRARQPSLVGIDISACRVKLLELDKAGESYRIAAYASEPLPDDAVHDMGLENVDSVGRVIRTTVERSGTRNRNAAIAVSGPSVISKTILMPAALDDMELEQQIHLDIEHYVSHSIQDVHVDFQILEPEPTDPNYNRVLLVACRRETIELHTAALEIAGLKVRLVDVEEYALQSACTLLAAPEDRHRADDCVAVFDVGALDTRLTILQDQRCRYTRSIAFGGRYLAATLVQRRQLADTEQLHSMLRIGELREADVATEVAGFAQELAAHIRRTLDFFLSAAESEQRIERIVVTGGVACYPGLEAKLRDALEWPTALGNPLAGMQATPAAQRNHVDSDAPALMVAAGLALRGVAR